MYTIRIYVLHLSRANIACGSRATQRAIIVPFKRLLGLYGDQVRAPHNNIIQHLIANKSNTYRTRNKVYACAMPSTRTPFLLPPCHTGTLMSLNELAEHNSPSVTEHYTSRDTKPQTNTHTNTHQWVDIIVYS